jgi:hypothetical protein
MALLLLFSHTHTSVVEGVSLIGYVVTTTSIEAAQEAGETIELIYPMLIYPILSGWH